MSETESMQESQAQGSSGRAPVTVEPPEEAAGGHDSGKTPAGPEARREPGEGSSSPAPQPPPPTPTQGGDSPMNAPQSPRTSGWTAEQYVQAFKEIVTAILAILLVGYTVSVARSTVSFIGDAQKIADAKDVLLLMLGLAGVVVGYYFGRVPADAQATQAQKQAAAATAQSEQVSAQAQQVAEQANRLVGRLATTGAVRREADGGMDPALTRELEELESSLQQLARRAQSRFA